MKLKITGTRASKSCFFVGRDSKTSILWSTHYFGDSCLNVFSLTSTGHGHFLTFGLLKLETCEHFILRQLQKLAAQKMFWLQLGDNMSIGEGQTIFAQTLGFLLDLLHCPTPPFQCSVMKVSSPPILQLKPYSVAESDICWAA